MELDVSYHFSRFTLTVRNVKSTEIGKALEKIEDTRDEMKKIYSKKRPKIFPVTK
ncbi:hypothetical protein [[Eubacterium] cellulosolvens]